MTDHLPAGNPPREPYAYLTWFQECIYDEAGRAVELYGEEAGGEIFTYIPCLNDRDDHIAVLLGVIENELKGWV